MLDDFLSYLRKMKKYNPDGYIVSDPFIITQIRKIDKKTQIHISTQQSVTNSKAALFFKRNECQRVILAREVSFSELKLLMKNVEKKIDIECFVHGAVCIAYSGRCMLSNNFCLRDANIGGCAQSCR
jgi:putative protease